MNNTDFDDYISKAIASYAIEKVKAGTWVEAEAHKRSEESFRKLLPKGLETEKQYLFSIVDRDEKLKVGYLWFGCDDNFTGKAAFVFDFLIFEEFRNKGYGTQSMKVLDEVAGKLGITKISLHVFAHNKRAIELYEKAGFNKTDISMSKYIV